MFTGLEKSKKCFYNKLIFDLPEYDKKVFVTIS